MDRLEEIKTAYAVEAAEYSDIFEQSHIGWLIAEVERLRLAVRGKQSARIQDLNDLADGFDRTSRSSTDGPVFRHCAKIAQAMIQDIELGRRP